MRAVAQTISYEISLALILFRVLSLSLRLRLREVQDFTLDLVFITYPLATL